MFKKILKIKHTKEIYQPLGSYVGSHEIDKYPFCKDCKWFAENATHNGDSVYFGCTHPRVILLRQSLVTSAIESWPRAAIAARTNESECGRKGKYWQAKGIIDIDMNSQKICGHTEGEVCAAEYAWGTPLTLRPVLCATCMRFVKSSAMLAKTEPCKD